MSSHIHRALVIAAAIATAPVLLWILLQVQVRMFSINPGVGVGWSIAQLSIPGLLVIWWRHRANRTDRKRAMAARADYEHAQLSQGNISVGVYGAFQPANTHRLS
jgi:hypothetical protein